MSFGAVPWSSRVRQWVWGVSPALGQGYGTLGSRSGDDYLIGQSHDKDYGEKIRLSMASQLLPDSQNQFSLVFT